jgi:hypothetical protein
VAARVERAARQLPKAQELMAALAAAQVEKETDNLCNQREQAILPQLPHHKAQTAAHQRLALRPTQMAAAAAVHRRQAQMLLIQMPVTAVLVRPQAFLVAASLTLVEAAVEVAAERLAAVVLAVAVAVVLQQQVRLEP